MVSVCLSTAAEWCKTSPCAQFHSPSPALNITRMWESKLVKELRIHFQLLSLAELGWQCPAKATAWTRTSLKQLQEAWTFLSRVSALKSLFLFASRFFCIVVMLSRPDWGSGDVANEQTVRLKERSVVYTCLTKGRVAVLYRKPEFCQQVPVRYRHGGCSALPGTVGFWRRSPLFAPAVRCRNREPMARQGEK